MTAFLFTLLLIAIAQRQACDEISFFGDLCNLFSALTTLRSMEGS